MGLDVADVLRRHTRIGQGGVDQVGLSVGVGRRDTARSTVLVDGTAMMTAWT